MSKDTQKRRLGQIEEGLAKLLIFSLCFPFLLAPPFILRGLVQVPEIIFGIYFIAFAVKKKWWGGSFGNRNLLDWGLAVYLLTMALACICKLQWACWVELIKIAYLFLLYQVLKVVLSEKEDISPFIDFFIYGALVAGSIGILGWLLSQFQIPNRFAFPTSVYYPYLGYVGRAIGPAQTPTMLSSILATALFLQFSRLRKNNGWIQHFIFLTILMALALTFSKIIALFLAMLMVLLSTGVAGFSKKVLKILAPLMIIFFLLGTHWVLLPKGKAVDHFDNTQGLYMPYPARAKIGHLELFETSYFLYKRAALVAGIQNLPCGAGPGNFRKFLVKNDWGDGPYAQFYKNNPGEPHSTYFGAFAEMGAIGVIAVLILFLIVFNNGYRLIRSSVQQGSATFYRALGVGLLFFCFLAITTDITNFRHFWFLLALVASLENKY